MSLLPRFAEELARMGVNIEITSDAGYLPNAITNILHIAKATGGHVTVDANPYLPNALLEWARIGGDSLTIRI